MVDKNKLLEIYGSKEAIKAEYRRRALKGNATIRAKVGEEGLSEMRRKAQAKSRLNYNGNGGFRSMDPARAEEIRKMGVAAKKRKKEDELGQD